MKYFLIMVTILSSLHCLAARHTIFKRYAGIVKRADSISIYSIEAYPVEPKAQDTNKKYVYEYPVTNKISLSKDSISSLKKAVLQKANYLTDVQKRCPFESSLAVVFTKGNKTVTLIISAYSCSKTLVYLPGTTTAAPYDLAENNSIEKVLPKQQVERL